MSSDLQQISTSIKSKALELGFDFVGFSKSEKLYSEEGKLRQWLDAGYQGSMTYLENHFDKRLDPSLLMPETRSVISLMYNYYPEKELSRSSFKLAKYAYGKDYHNVIKKRLKGLTSMLESLWDHVSYRVFVDSAPVMERQWAAQSGLGWIGKNTLLINKEKGSFFFLAEILIDKELAYDGPIKDHCGSCTACLDACPTDAFESPYVLNASKCISYQSIELKDAIIDSSFKGKFDDWMFGCDICQDVCPWNRFSTPHKESKFEPSNELKEMNDQDWKKLSEKKFTELFQGSAVQRAKYKGLRRNIDFLEEN